MSDTPKSPWERAEDIFVARSILADGRRQRPVFGIAELVAYFEAPDATLTPEQTRALFVDPKLRAAFARLREEARLFELPQAAAASDGEITERVFPGGVLRVTPASRGAQLYLSIAFEAPVEPMPSTLLLTAEDGRLARLRLADIDAEGRALIVLDPGRPADAAALELLRDPAATGAFIR